MATAQLSEHLSVRDEENPAPVAGPSSHDDQSRPSDVTDFTGAFVGNCSFDIEMYVCVRDVRTILTDTLKVNCYF